MPFSTPPKAVKNFKYFSSGCEEAAQARLRDHQKRLRLDGVYVLLPQILILHSMQFSFLRMRKVWRLDNIPTIAKRIKVAAATLI